MCLSDERVRAHLEIVGATVRDGGRDEMRWRHWESRGRGAGGWFNRFVMVIYI